MLQSDGNNTVNDRDSSSIDDDKVNNPGRSTVIKISTDASRSKVNDDTCPGHTCSEKMTQRLMLSPQESFLVKKTFQQILCQQIYR